MSEEFKDDYNLEALTRVQPAGDDFDLEVTPRYVTAYTQGYEALTSRVVKAQLAAADLFIDVGAHYGYYTLLGALAHPRLRVVAVEPVPENHAILRRNLARHGLGADRVTPVQAAVSAATGTAELFKSEASDNSSLYPHPASGTLGRIAVPTVALDELVAAHPAERIFVKLDTDGHELEVLRGFARTLADHPAVTLALEINPKMFRIAGSSTEELLARLAEHGFKAYAMDDRASRFYPLDQPANLARLEALYAQSFYNVLCVRAERALSAVFFAHSAQAAGAERSLADAVGGLARRGVLCTVVLPGDGPLAPQLAQAGAALFRAPINGALANGWNWAGRGAARAWRADLAETRDYFALEVTPELQQLAPDVIFTQTMVCPWGAFCAERLGVPHALSVREYGELDQQLAFYAGGLNASADALYASSAAVFCINREIKDLLFGADPDRKTEVVYSGIQAEPIRAAAGRDAASPALGAAPRIGLFATLAPGKGQMDLVRACARLAGQGRAFTCHLAGRVGDAAYAAALREAVAESGCADRFVWLGALENPYPALRAMDLLVSCSVREALGRSLIEAMLLDVPVIYADSGGPREVYTANEHGLAYPPGDVDALCAAITEVLDQPAAAARRAVKARDHARQVFDPETFGDRLEQRLRQCARTVRTEGMPVTRLLGAENATHAAPPFQPAFFYAPADEGFAPERMVSGVPSTFGPFAQSVTLPGAGFPRVRFDPLEAPAAHLRLFRIELETADGVRLSSTDFTCHANGIARDEAWAWDFPTPDPQVVFTAQQPVKCIRIWGELRELSCRRLTALAEDLRVRGAAPPAAPESRPPRWLRLLAAAQGVRRRWSPALPPDFDADLYLRLNRDVAAAGCDPAAHYLANGRAEGRPYRLLPQFAADLPASRPAILVVSHEASRSGAPIIALNLVQALSAQYEVYVLLLNGGPLAPAFRQAAVQVVQVPTDAPPEWRAPYLIAQLCARRTFAFAVVNSVASHEVLAPLADQDIPTVTLIHEFASDAFDPECFRQAFLGSTELVFPAALVRADALARHPEAESARWHVAPQGRCVAPAAPDPARRAAEAARLRALLRPEGAADQAVVVLGVGARCYRKAVDVFLACAARAARAAAGRPLRFVWIGAAGQDPKGREYAALLRDQARRMAPEAQVIFVGETAAIEAAYEAADIFLLPSRLDPLPNVAIEAMSHGLPVVCFDRASGIAEFLAANGLAAPCVAAYLDVADLTDKLLALADSSALRRETGARCRAAGAAAFDPERYARQIAELGQAARAQTDQEQADADAIRQSGLAQPEFMYPAPAGTRPLPLLIRGYVRAWAAGICRRKPCPGFHPGIYREMHGVSDPGADPFADYLRAGQPAGPWRYPVLDVSTPPDGALPQSGAVALHLHVHYPELLPDILRRLARNRVRPDLFVSMTHEALRPEIERALATYDGHIAECRATPNRGRDLGPFLTAFGPRLRAQYEFIGHLHTKKTATLPNPQVAANWREFLLANLLGHNGRATADAILAALQSDPQLGLVFPDDPLIVGWGTNRQPAEPLAERLGLSKLPENLVFPVGAMFWARTAALAPLFDLALDWHDYPPEPLPPDGTTLHALERLIALVPPRQGFHCAATYLPGVTR